MGDAEKDEGTASANPESAAQARIPSGTSLLNTDESVSEAAGAALETEAATGLEGDLGLDPAQTTLGRTAPGETATLQGHSGPDARATLVGMPSEPVGENAESSGWTVPPPPATESAPVESAPIEPALAQSAESTSEPALAQSAESIGEPALAQSAESISEPSPVESAPIEPALAQSAESTSEPALAQSAESISESAPVESAPVESAPIEPALAQSAESTIEPALAQSAESTIEPEPVEPALAQSAESISEPAPVESAPVEPASEPIAAVAAAAAIVTAATVTAATVESPEDVARYRHLAITPKLESISGEGSESQPPPQGRSLRSKPPPKPTQYRSEPPPMPAPLAAEMESVSRSALAEKIQTHSHNSRELGEQTPPLSQATTQDPASPAPSSAVTSIPPVESTLRREGSVASSPRKSKLPMVFWGLSLVVVFMMGLAFGSPSSVATAKLDAEQKARVAAARADAFAEGKAAQEPPLPAFDLTAPAGAKNPQQTEKAAAPTRSRLDAIALGRYWSQQRYDALMQLTAQLKQAPQKLADEKVRSEVLKYVGDRASSRLMLETLAELATVPALDILYEVWIGSKERNEVTQLAEALLLANDVRPHASKALELALSLREKPTDCSNISTIVEGAIREGDRRSAMQLVNMGARVNCGPSGDQECIKCLADSKDLRKAVHAAVARPAPL